MRMPLYEILLSRTYVQSLGYWPASMLVRLQVP